MSTGDDERDEFTEDWFEDVAGEPGGLRDPDAETWLEEPAPPPPAYDRRTVVAALAAVVALIVIGVGIARVVSGGDDEGARTTATTQTQPGTTGATETQTQTQPSATLPEDITLRSGNSGPNVRRLQRALASLGYDVGKADGAFGAATEEGVKQFQADSGLDADGIAGPTTIAAINDALASQS